MLDEHECGHGEKRLVGLLLMHRAPAARMSPRRASKGFAQPCGYTGFGSGLVPRKTANARSMKPTPARISATPTTMLKIATPVAM